MLEKILWILAIVSLWLPWMWPLNYAINVNVSDLVKRIIGIPIDKETWFDRLSEKVDTIMEKISNIGLIWQWFTFPVLTCLSIYETFNQVIVAERVMFLMLFLFFFFTEIYLLVKELSFKKTTQQ